MGNGGYVRREAASSDRGPGSRCASDSPVSPRPTGLRRVGVNDLDQGANVVHGGLGQDAVSEVEDMARAAPGLRQDSPRLLLDLLNRGQEHDGIEAALN